MLLICPRSNLGSFFFTLARSAVLLSEPVTTVFRKLELGLALEVCPMPRKSTMFGSRLTKFKELG